MDLLALATKKSVFGELVYDLVFPDTAEVPEEYRGHTVRVAYDPLLNRHHLYYVDVPAGT